MDVREKLVELIAQKVCDTWSESCDEWLPHDCGKCYANDCHISEIADHLIANCITVQEWISVDDMLPEDDSDVLAYSRIGEESRIYPACYSNGVWFDCVFNAPATDTTTHWMPLPKPPKEEESK